VCTAQIAERLPVIEQQHRGHGAVGVVGAANIDGAAKDWFCLQRPSELRKCNGPIVEKSASGFGVVASERGQARRGLLEGANGFTKLSGTAIRLSQVHEDTQLQHLGLNWRDLQESLRSLRPGNGFLRSSA